VVSSEGEKVEKIAILPEDIYFSNTKPPGPDMNRIKGKLIEIGEIFSTVYRFDRKKFFEGKSASGDICQYDFRYRC